MTPAALADLIRTSAVEVLVARGVDQHALPDAILVERPRNREHGDYATNVALQVAKKVGLTPRELAEAIAERVAASEEIDAAEVAGPGFLNFRLAAKAQGEQIRQVLVARERFGTGDELAGSKINLEFVSANPTGPIHLGGSRWAAVGDALGRILSAQGAEVTREYYFNDAGAQIDRFVSSLVAAAKGEPAPADGYAGGYVSDIAAEVIRQEPNVLSFPEEDRDETFRRIGVGLMFTEIKQSLHEFGTDFDVFFHEDSLHTSGAVTKAVEKLKESGQLYLSEDAWWLRSSEYGDDKDRVVIKNDGTPAYIAGDIAYLQDKIDRGFTLCIYMLGADHHGYIARLKAAAAAMGNDPAVVEVMIGQMVNLVSDGKPVRMSKRAGTVITLEDLVEAVGVDAARYELVRYSTDSTVDIDLDLLRKHSNDNPVYYVQYAHARLCSLLRNAADLGLISVGDSSEILDDGNLCEIDFGLLELPGEGELIRTIGDFPTVVRTATQLREPHRVARYLEGLAAAYHKFYDVARVLPQGDEEANELTHARLALCDATRQVLANGLSLLGVSAPGRM